MAPISAAMSSGGMSCIRLRSENFRNTADIGGDDRHSGGRCLQHHIGQRFRARRDDEHPPHREGLARRTVADETNLIGDAETLRLRLEFCGVRSFAGDRRADAAGRIVLRIASASISTSIALTGRNSPTHTMSVASGRGVTGSNSASAMPLRTTRTMPAAGRSRCGTGLAI